MTERLYRKVIRICAEMSPNVQLGLAELAAGKEPSNEIILPGVITYDEYVKRRATWDPIRQCVGLDGLFYEGAEIKLYPTAWLGRANKRAKEMVGSYRRAQAIGVDPAEGGDSTCICVIDHEGILELDSYKTPDTNSVPGLVREAMRKWGVRPERVCFDRGGGGKQHADRMRAMGLPVRSIGFGERPSLPIKNYRTATKDKKAMKEEQYAYKNLRAEMYWELRELLDPFGDPVSSQRRTFAIPAWGHCIELLRQMRLMPLWYDEHSRFYMPPKQKRGEELRPGADQSDKPTLTDIVGCSPDETDSLVLAVHALLHKDQRPIAGPPG